MIILPIEWNYSRIPFACGCHHTCILLIAASISFSTDAIFFLALSLSFFIWPTSSSMGGSWLERAVILVNALILKQCNIKFSGMFQVLKFQEMTQQTQDVQPMLVCQVEIIYCIIIVNVFVLNVRYYRTLVGMPIECALNAAEIWIMICKWMCLFILDQTNTRSFFQIL